MADDFDALWNSTEAGKTYAEAPLAAPPEVTFDSLWNSTEATPTGLMPALGQVGRGLTLGYFNEAEGAAHAVANEVQNLFGYGNDQSFNQNWDNVSNATRKEELAYEDANPISSLLLQVLGGAIPAIGSGGANYLAGGTIKAAPGIIGTLGRNVLGVGIEEAPSLLNLAKMGATQGAIYGSGESEDNRLGGAAFGGGIGAVAGPVIGKTIQTGTNLVTDALARLGIIGPGAGSNLASEAGAFSLKPGGTSYTPEELFLAKQLKNTPSGKVAAGASELTSAVDQDIPLFLPEAVGSPKVDRNARFIANYEPSMEYSQSAIESRAQGASERINSLLSKITSEVDPTDAGTGLINASQKAVSQLEKVRRDTTAPLYKLLEGQKVPDEVAINLLDDPVIDAAVSSVSKNPAYQKELGKAAPESFKYLQLTKEHLNDQVNELARAGRTNEARIVGESRDKVVAALDQLNEYKEANSLYRKLSQPINKLTGTKEEAGLLEGILNTDRIKAHQAPAELLRLTPAQITKVKDTLGAEGEEQLKKSARSLMQDVLSKADERSQPALKLLQNSDMRDKFRAMIGDAEFERFAEGIDLEKRIALGKNKYGAGSTTEGNQQENRDFQKGASTISKFMSGNKLEAIKTLFGGDMPDELAQKMAKIYFDPKKGSESLKKILPLLEQYEKNKDFSKLLGKVTGSGTATQSAKGITDIRYPDKKPMTGLYTDPNAEKSQLNQSLTNVLGDQTVNKEEIKALDSGAFEKKVNSIAEDLGADPEHIMQVMQFETGGTLDPAEKNRAGSGATGLIQFMPATAKALTGKSSGAEAIKFLEKMTPTEQLDYVKKYLEPYKGKLNTLEDVYMAVLYPKAIGKGNEYPLFKRGTEAYRQNAGLDIDLDGIVTKAEAAKKVETFEV